MAVINSMKRRLAMQGHNELSKPFSILPSEIIIHILSFLGPKELVILALVCHKLNQICEDDHLWKVIFERKFPRLTSILLKGLTNHKRLLKEFKDEPDSPIEYVPKYQNGPPRRIAKTRLVGAFGDTRDRLFTSLASENNDDGSSAQHAAEAAEENASNTM